ncbi:MAG: hypothetical protein ACE37F_08325 [Nannocystaceae bacterium]|nr:hypothetical protein [bacterium]
MFLATGTEPELIRELYGYLLGLALRKYGLLFHGGNQMGNHHHLDLTDVRGQRPLFKAYFHGFLARALNSLRGRTGNFWESGGSCDTVRDNDEEYLADLVYTDTNPVSAGLVRWPERWPGFHSADWAFGETRTFRRPSMTWFDLVEGEWPDEVSITRTRPPCLSSMSDAEATALLRDRTRQRCVEKQHEMKVQHRRFKGVDKLARERWWRRPGSNTEDFTVKPKVAVRCKYRRRAMIQRNKTWEAEYLEADEAFAAGDRDVVYPYGTWLQRFRYAVNVAAPP